ncbi:hypothetical protein Hanom_Chr03g00218361 [Helianthus anomalus]
MSLYWDNNYIFGSYSSTSWVPENVPSGVPDSNEQEEVVSSVQGKQNRPFLDLNTLPYVDETSPVNNSYHAMLMNQVIRRNKVIRIMDTGKNIVTCNNTILMDTEETVVISNSFPEQSLRSTKLSGRWRIWWIWW